jgi:glutamine synthetase
MSNDMQGRVKEDGVKFISLQFSDVTGVVKSVDIPVKRLNEALEDGIWFDGSSVEGFARIQESDMRLVLDPDTYAVLPWSPVEGRRARVFCNIYTPDGQPFAGDPRGALKNALEKLKQARGWTLNVGPEPEFFLFKRDQALFTRSRMMWAATSISRPMTKRSRAHRADGRPDRHGPGRGNRASRSGAGAARDRFPFR